MNRIKPTLLKGGSLFSGIGGLDLGLERSGLVEINWQVECSTLCQNVLFDHFGVPVFPDVRGFEAPSVVDLICGGFPCQDVSQASRGKGAGMNGSRSGLWREFKRIVKCSNPEWVIVENVSGAAEKTWLPVVRRDLWKDGYSGVPLRVLASQVGAPFQGARVFVVATTNGDCQSIMQEHAKAFFLRALAKARRKDWGSPSPEALGVANGVPRVMDQLSAYGNSVVPAMAEAIGYWVQMIRGV